MLHLFSKRIHNKKNPKFSFLTFSLRIFFEILTLNNAIPSRLSGYKGCIYPGGRTWRVEMLHLVRINEWRRWVACGLMEEWNLYSSFSPLPSFFHSPSSVSFKCKEMRVRQGSSCLWTGKHKLHNKDSLARYTDQYLWRW